LATSSTDFQLKIWDIEKGAEFINIGHHADIIQSVAWNWDGSLWLLLVRIRRFEFLIPDPTSLLKKLKDIKELRDLVFLG